MNVDIPEVRDSGIPVSARFVRDSWPILVPISIVLILPCFWHRHIEANDLGSHTYNAWLVHLIRQERAPGLWVKHIWDNVLFDWMLSGVGSLFWFGGDGPAPGEAGDGAGTGIDFHHDDGLPGGRRQRVRYPARATSGLDPIVRGSSGLRSADGTRSINVNIVPIGRIELRGARSVRFLAYKSMFHRVLPLRA